MKENITVSKLANGLVVLTDKMEGVRSATLGFFSRIGARNESEDLSGITHLIEHAVFKGTRRRSALDIAIEQDRLGGTLDAFTTHEETGFVIKVIDDEVEQAFDLLADILTEPLFDQKDLENEQNVIVEEMKMVEDSPEEYLGEIFSETFFPGHPLGRNIAGTPETVKTFDHTKTLEFHKMAFDPANLVITAAGAIDHHRIEEMAGRVWNSSSALQRKRAGPPEYAAPIVIRQNENLEQAHMLIATPMVSAVDESRYAADLLASIIGGGTSSRLWQKIREERGLAYSVGAGAVMFTDCGYFSIFVATSPEQVEDVIDLSIAELREVVKNAVTEKELDLAKAQARAAILLSLEDSASRAGSLANLELTHGRQISVEETLASIDAVTVDETVALARECFQTEKIAFAALGDLKRLKIDRDRLAI